jgi:hypothetical protein
MNPPSARDILSQQAIEAYGELTIRLTIWRDEFFGARGRRSAAVDRDTPVDCQRMHPRCILADTDPR